MKTVTVNKDEFIEKVQANRDNHRAIFEEAQKGYYEYLVAELVKRLAEARRGLKIDHYINLTIPEDHTDDYDQVLEMAKMSINDTLELTQQDFASYVMDRWSWKQQWIASNSGYTAAAR